jgi:hypothetical protein
VHEKPPPPVTRVRRAANDYSQPPRPFATFIFVVYNWGGALQFGLIAFYQQFTPQRQ